ncbi:hypothetical protein OEA41_010657 [Lepraria neglecta]|uniref:Heterokaryon incompatibility domain-containing protein n=1 Tax=Lepraria neglecta TaxID=209136 RepID=A0AAE0DFR9_9LECA|nr:hypothetical protein OEA41_010657 [Lepraria neglecta]
MTSIANNAPTGSDLFLATPTGTAAAIGIGSESMVKFSSSAGYSRVWTVQLELAEDGDCGSWAVNRKGELLGMLIGSCDVAREAYILPARTIFAEIEAASNKSVSLPSLEQADRPSLSKDTIPMAAEYTYSPLKRDEIRILTLMPGDDEAPIECYLAIGNIDAHLEYEALSYGGDRSTPSSLVKLQHHFPVSHQLISALKALRYKEKARYLWVDKFFINGNDNGELNAQVALMARLMSQESDHVLWQV